MIEIKEDISLQEPLDLANAYGEYLLMVGNDGKPAQGSEVPEDVYIRYESAQELLFIDSRVFSWLHLDATLANWRKTNQYCGSLVKRMCSGSGRLERSRSVLCFDLSEKPEAREHPIKPRRGKPLLVERVKARAAAAEKTTETILSIHNKVKALRSTYGDHPAFGDVEKIFVECKRMLEEVNRVAERGRARGPGKKKKVTSGPIAPIKLDALDSLVNDNLHAILRILKRTVVTDGKPRWEDRVIKPDIPAEDWLGRYEEVRDVAAGLAKKQLFVPVSVLKSMSELADYKQDYRYVTKIYRQIGSKSVYCAVFDLDKKFDIVQNQHVL